MLNSLGKPINWEYNSRIIKVEQDRVYFSYKDYADKGRTKVMALDVYEFMRRYLLHVLPHRFVKLRYYGLLGYKDRKKKLCLCRKLLDVKEGSREREIPEIRKELYEYVTGHEVSSVSNGPQPNR